MYLRHEIGKIGENLATEYLKKQGYTIIERNFVANQGEIDIVARDNSKRELVFIEVKTRTNTVYGRPIEAINESKQKHLISTAKYYIYSK